MSVIDMEASPQLKSHKSQEKKNEGSARNGEGKKFSALPSFLLCLSSQLSVSRGQSVTQQSHPEYSECWIRLGYNTNCFAQKQIISLTRSKEPVHGSAKPQLG